VTLPRADVRRGRLAPASTDLAALSATGERPAIWAFALCLTGTGALVYEVLNDEHHATYVYRAGDADAVAALNRALDLVGFRVDAVHAEPATATRTLPAPRLLRDAFIGRVDHGDGWADDLARLFAVG
jgi:hypothetical protein